VIYLKMSLCVQQLHFVKKRRGLLITASQPALLTASGLTSMLSPSHQFPISHADSLRVVIGLLIEHNTL